MDLLQIEIGKGKRNGVRTHTTPLKNHTLVMYLAGVFFVCKNNSP